MNSLSSGCAGFARDPAKVEDQVRFLARTLKFDAGARRHGGCLGHRREAVVYSLKRVRLPPASFECNYKQGLTSLGQRRAAHSINGWCRVFRTWDLAKAMLNPPPRLAQWVEHQTVIWLSRVRLPYRHRRLQSLQTRRAFE